MSEEEDEMGQQGGGDRKRSADRKDDSVTERSPQRAKENADAYTGAAALGAKLTGTVTTSKKRPPPAVAGSTTTNQGQQQPLYRKHRKKKPVGVKRALSAYNIFFRDERARLLRARDEGGAECSEIGTSKAAELFSVLGKAIAKRWKELDSDQRAQYVAAAASDLKRYRQEMDEYHTNLALQKQTEPSSAAKPESSEGVQVASLPAVPSGPSVLSVDSSRLTAGATATLDSSGNSSGSSSLQQHLERAAAAAAAAENNSFVVSETFPTEAHQLLELLRQRQRLASEFSLGATAQLANPSLSELSTLLSLQNQFASSTASPPQPPPPPQQPQPTAREALELLQQQQQQQQQQQRQSYESLEDQYMRAALEQERARLVTARLARQLQMRSQQNQLSLQRQQEMARVLRLHQQQQQQQQQSSLASTASSLGLLPSGANLLPTASHLSSSVGSPNRSGLLSSASNLSSFLGSPNHRSGLLSNASHLSSSLGSPNRSVTEGAAAHGHGVTTAAAAAAPTDRLWPSLWSTDHDGTASLQQQAEAAARRYFASRNGPDDDTAKGGPS
jgi:HMG (high mobility group) box